MNFTPLEHQQQPDDLTCTAACLAMILEVPVAEIVAEFHENYFNHKQDIDAYLHTKDVIVIPGLTSRSYLYWHRIYLLAVPSLNVEALYHSVVADTRIEGKVRILDPNEGRPNKKFYSYNGGNGSVKLNGYHIDYEVMGVN